MVSYRRATEADSEALSALLNASHADNLTADERRTAGFVQGDFSPYALRRFLAGPASVVAVAPGADAALLGCALTSTSPATTGPAAELDRFCAEHLADRRWVAYGPVAVAANQRGRGITRGMLGMVKHLLSQQGFNCAVAFIDERNQHSLAVHEHLGFAREGSFDYGGHRYQVVSG
ncbi:hypothetical protein C3B44_03270 [Corynebacterium yudongzhengii]|uniref:N-acetyltransferase n=1 Tax=Corynebacterium yudongzhengii TaxID=2080740 RepID=A0A2U1T7J5_9CORY|nr:GNAT family protein [Corynebacterium yudongzhengii]AWB81494.1 hypothetical protein C3B44_03270 [Corynebacterium yudongzhengii]PWC01935.1 N-acetyltransferase [Corynebacterium yudongzhengii]